MKAKQLLLCGILLVPVALTAQTGEDRSAAQLAEAYIKLRDPARVDDLKKFPPEQAVPAYYKLRRKAWEPSVRDRAELLMLNTPGWDKWFLDTLWTLLPGSLYGPTDEWGDWIYEDPDRFERVLKISDRVKSQRQAADDLIYYLGSIRDPKVIRILGPILLLEGETYKDFDVSWQSSNAKADIALSDMNVYGFPAFKPSDIQHKWWLKNKDLTDEQWWELLRKGHEEIVKLHTPFTSEGRPNPPPPPPPAPVTPPPTLVPKPITPVPAPRIIRGSSLSTPRRQPHVPQLASEAGAFWPRWFAVGSVTTSLGWLLLRKGDNSSQG